MLITQFFRHCWKPVSLLVIGFGLMTAITGLPTQASTFSGPSPTQSALATPLVTPLPNSHNLMALATTPTTTDTVTGTFGSSDWSLQAGTLTIGPGDFANNSSSTSPWAAYSSQITKIEITGPVTFNTYAAGLFAGFANLAQIDGLENVDTSKTISFDDLFHNDSQLTDLTGVEHWQTSNVRTLNRTFFATALIGTLDLSHWDVSSLTGASMAFARAGALDENSNRLFNLLDLSGWNFKTAKVNLATFGYQLQANAINTTGWENTSHITSMESMFTFSRIQKIDMSSFDMRQLNNSYGGTRQMFTYASVLKELKVGPYTKLAGTGLPSIAESNKYTGYWQNIGSGTVTNPNGDQVLTTAQLVAAYDGSKTQATDTFVWQPKASQPVTVNYVDATTGKVIQPATTITGAIEDPFTITPPAITGYRYQGTQDDASLTGSISADAQAVTLLYQQQPTEGSITVNYLDTAGKTIAPAQTMTGQLGSHYTIDPKAITGYTYQSGELTGTYTETNHAVNLIYQKNVAHSTVTVNYVDSDGTKIAEPTTLTGPVDSAYTIEKKAISGYTFQSGALTGNFAATPKTVTLSYQKDAAAQGTVTVNYLDDQGKVIAPAKTLTGDLDAPFAVSQPTIDGYTFKHADGNLSGNFTKEPQTVNLIYQATADKQGSVIIKFQTTDGQSLTEDTRLTGTIDSDYTITPPTFKQYQYQKASGNLTGKFSSETPTVVLTYAKQTADQGQVTVHYLDLNGQQLAPVDTLSGPLETAYTTTAKSIAGYSHVKTTGQPTGTFSSQVQNVNYYYQKQTGSNDQRQLTGQDYTMVVNGTTPTASDFKAAAKDKTGHSIAVKVDLSQAKLNQVGTYQVTLRTDDGQTLVVKLHVIAANSGSNEATDKLTPGQTQKPNQPVSANPLKPVQPATTTKPRNPAKILPATGEVVSHLGLIVGLISLSVIGLKFRKHF